MVLYFGLILGISLFCLGLRAITDEGMIGYPIRAYALKNFPVWGKPVILCSTCMSSFWGTILFWSFFISLEIQLSPIIFCYWIVITISTAFVNAVAWEYYTSINQCDKK